MTVIANAGLVLKDSQGNKGIVKSFTDNDIDKISSAITDVGQVVDPATHMPIEATKTSAGVVQLATAQDITNGTAGKVVDAQELNNFAQTLPAANGVTDVSSGDNSNQLVVSRIGGSKTLTIDNVEHAGNADEATHASQADTATSANSVAWDNVSGKPSSYTPSSHTHDDRYYTESEIDTKLGGKSNTDHTHSNYLTGITKAMVTTALGYTPPTSDTNTHYTTTLYAGAKDAKSNAATTNGNTYIKLYDDSTVRSQLNIKGSGATTVTTDANGVITINSTDTNTTYSKLSQFTNDSGYITGITKAMVTNALGYTPPTQDTNTWNALKGSTTSAAGTAGYAPAPAAGAANRYLRCDGTWQVPPDNNTTYNFAGTTFYSGNKDTAEHNANNAVKNGNYYYNSNGPATSLGASTNDGALYVQSHSDSWVGQIAQDYRNGRLFVRGKNNGTWQAWKVVIDSSTIGSQSVNYANSAGAVAWANVSGKPSTYTPSSHTHDDRYYTESEINTKLSNLLLQIYPVGAIYISANSTNPGKLFGGTWKALDQGRVLIGANNTYKAGATGGEFTHTITTSEMPSHTHTGTTGNQSAGHTHTWSGTTSSNGSHAHTASSNSTGAHQHNSGHGWHYAQSLDEGTGNKTCLAQEYISSDNYSGNVTSSSGSHSHTITVNSNGAHTHTVSGTTGGISANHTHSFTTGASGSGSAMNNMQPYLAVYMWQRTA